MKNFMYFPTSDEMNIYTLCYVMNNSVMLIYNNQ
jgi:hypothetical protein